MSGNHPKTEQKENGSGVCSPREPGKNETLPSDKPKKGISKREIITGILAIIVTIGLGVAAVMYKDVLINYAAGYSLIGILVISFLAGSLLSFTAVPLPYWILVFTLPSVLAMRWGLLAPFLVALVSALGTTVGHMPTFMIGYGGRSLSEKITSRFNNRLYQRLINWSKKHGWIAVYVNSAIINPVHLPMTIAFGTLCYPPWKFFVFSFLGNTTKGLFFALSGYFGLTSLLHFLGG